MTLNAIPSSTTANSYVTVDEASAYFANRLHATAWDNAIIDGTDEAALIEATDRLDQYDYIGLPVSTLQALKWPRYADDDEEFIERADGRVYDGVTQIETATIAGTVTGDGDATVVVTAAGLTGSPLTLNVAVLNLDTASAVATKIRAALNANVDIAEFFTVGGAGTAVSLEALSAATHDTTMNLSYTNGTCTGLTPGLTSTDTRYGSLAMIPLEIKKATFEMALARLNLTTDAVAAGTVSELQIGSGVKVKYAGVSSGEFFDATIDQSGLPLPAARFLKGLRIVNVLA